MIATLPERSRKSLAAVKQDLADLRDALVPDRPLSMRSIRDALDDVLELWPDLEEDLLADLAQAHEDGEVWHPDDLVVLTQVVEAFTS
jgi:hypothetical protein